MSKRARSEGAAAPAAAKRQRSACPHLDTVRRENIDFDMPPRCSVTLSPQNVYACLVCGKFFQGRSEHTAAYTHAVEQGHYVFINLATTRIFCLPEGYEVREPSLSDIQRACCPVYSIADVENLYQPPLTSTDCRGEPYVQGCVGLNNCRKKSCPLF